MGSLLLSIRCLFRLDNALLEYFLKGNLQELDLLIVLLIRVFIY